MPPPPPRHRRRRAAVVALALAAGLPVAASPGSAATPCGKRIVQDWYEDGRIDRLYPLRCYQEGIDAIPEELRPYTDADEVILRAFQAALRGQLPPGPKKPPNGGPPRVNPIPPTAEPPPSVDTSDPAAVPVPLLVLGGLSLALLGAGGLGYLSRRRHPLDPPDEDE